MPKWLLLGFIVSIESIDNFQKKRVCVSEYWKVWKYPNTKKKTKKKQKKKKKRKGKDKEKKEKKKKNRYMLVQRNKKEGKYKGKKKKILRHVILKSIISNKQ